jgi:mannose-1-phosphate guanylyltransferase/mannose-6-phosphate isomerase
MVIQPVILCGGSGSRLWPLSRQDYPKQFLALMDDKSLLQNTVLRLQRLHPFNAPIVVCNEAHRFLVSAQLREIDIFDAQIILEPEGKNTAPAIGLAAHTAVSLNPDSVLLVLPSDHWMTEPDQFVIAAKKAVVLATENSLVTFGIKPVSPETGYGYVKRGLKLGAGYHVEAFVEKPDLKTAQSYLASGDYFWNSGMFVFSAANYLEALKQWAPEISSRVENAFAIRDQDDQFIRPDKASFKACPADSVDYAVFEKADNVALVPLDAGWSDIGSWQSLWAVSAKDARNNSVQGDVILDKARNSFVRATNRLVTLVGVDSIVVIETADAVLVAASDASQQVKQVVDTLNSADRQEHLLHRRVHRPWGWYETVDQGPRHLTKRISVDPGERLSLQKHRYRAEHWVVVRGIARVTCNDQTFDLVENESTYIPVGALHRLMNPGQEALEIIEVQTGQDLRESDIERFDDAYGRAIDTKP